MTPSGAKSSLSLPVPKIPDGWTMEQAGPRDRRCSGGQRYLTLDWREGDRTIGMVTVDWLDRTYRLGAVWTGRPAITKKCQGRGWSQTLVDDAVAALRAVV